MIGLKIHVPYANNSSCASCEDYGVIPVIFSQIISKNLGVDAPF